MDATTSARGRCFGPLAAVLVLTAAIGCARDQHDLRLNLRVGDVYRYDLVHSVSRHALPEPEALDFVEIGVALRLEVVEARPEEPYALRITVERLRVEQGSPSGGFRLDSMDVERAPLEFTVEVSPRATHWRVRGLEAALRSLGGEEPRLRAFDEVLSDSGLARLAESLFRPRPDKPVVGGEIWSEEWTGSGSRRELALYKARGTEELAGRRCLLVGFETRVNPGGSEGEGAICIDLETGLPLSSGLLTEREEASTLVHRHDELTLRGTR